MHSRVPRLISFVTAVSLGAAALLPVGPALATAEPPFELTFPQETSKTWFTSSYGDHRSGGRSHKGNDLIAPRMTEVYAAAAGTVIHVGTNRLSGRNVRIEHQDGWTSHYVHLNNDNPGTDDGDAPWTLTVAPGVEVGMHVEAGQLIGWVGDSGNAEGTTPHTHFELRVDDKPINPFALLTDAYERKVAAEAAAHMAKLATELPDVDFE
ncbi:MAG TPA: M23 family metallopeptidase [Acidimicrobiia bacterium]|nr:M23 family metallopeptidase [Acidimicrobiia bacterium]